MPPADPATLITQAAQAFGRGDLAGAEAAARAALALQRSADGLHLLGLARAHQGATAEGAALLTEADRVHPGQPQLLLNLGKVLMADGRFGEAEAVLERGLVLAPAALKADLAADLFAAQRRQHKREAALKTATLLRGLDPNRREFENERVDLLTELGRHEDALALLRTMLQQEPANARLLQHYSGQLYQLGREDEAIAVYDAAPPELQLDKAVLLFEAGRHEDAHAVHAALLASEPDNPVFRLRAAALLAQIGRAGEALALLEDAQARQPDDIDLQAGTGNAALLSGDAQKAAAMLERVVAQVPHDHLSLARLSTAWRLLGDARDETLMGYDELVRIFDLEPPPGFGDMAAFNAELEGELQHLHRATRESLGQSLRGGTQTQGHLFAGGHVLVDLLRTRIDQAVSGYIAQLAHDPAHPLRGRRGRNFSYAGSWSSRLADCGFHTNHIHPMGWISSCYYVGLPAAVADETAKQGWIKFGEPNVDLGLSFRRAIQPRPGRLVLFPSYMWHGTIPFQGPEKRTTIAFDVIPT
jgi:predicted Zn-dependent protease